MKHARQRTDRIHGTIYLSAFESELSSTPFFYRLHDIYQSSTVYLTFPSNRTKRYEHSLGTMALASELLFSSITNADTPTRAAFIEKLNAEFTEIYRKIFTRDYNATYFGESGRTVIDIVEKSHYAKFEEKKEPNELDRLLDDDIKITISKNLLSDDALNHFSLHSTKNDADTNRSSSRDASYSPTAVRERFIYQCILQAVRIVALFHDVGHPPFSHIIEHILEDLYKEYKKSSSTWNPTKCKKLKSTLGRYLDCESGLQKLLFINTEKPSISPHLHEQVGGQMFRMAVESTFSSMLEPVASDTFKSKMIVVLYYITVIEFAAAILLEKNDLFRSIHRIVDGIIDSDRLDYTVRDSFSSGVDWGSIPYKRLIDSAKLLQVDRNGNVDLTKKSSLFVIAYPQKVAPDIEDFLIERYKIYARINFHHRCVKTATALQSAVKILARDYLAAPITPFPQITESGLEYVDSELSEVLEKETPDDNENRFPVIISPNIHILWTTLGPTNGDETLKVLQWNDSWMISALQSALLRIRTEDNFETKFLLQSIRKAWNDVYGSKEWTEKTLDEKKEFLNTVKSDKKVELSELCKNLEEFLLNKKAYYSMFKRGSDVKHFIDDVIKYAGLSIPDIENQLDLEKQQYFDTMKSGASLPPLWKCLDDSEENDNRSASGAVEAVARLHRFLTAAKVGDLQPITSIIPPDSASAKDIIGRVLDDAVQRKEILDYKTHINTGRGKMGLPSHDGDPTNEIFLYDAQHVFKYDESLSLKPQLKAIEQSILWLYIYVIPAKNCENVPALLTALRTRCAQAIGTAIRNQYNGLFEHN